MWVAPASSSQKLRRMASLAIAGPNDPRRPAVQRAKSQRASQLIAEAAGSGATSYVGDVSRPTRLAPSEFDRLCAQATLPLPLSPTPALTLTLALTPTCPLR